MQKNYNILCCDPSLTAFGYAVMDCLKSDKEATVAFGCIKTGSKSKMLRIRKGDDRCRRYTEIAETLKMVIEQNEVKYVLAELPHGSQNAVAATSLGGVTGLLIGLCLGLDIGIEWYSEGDSKKWLLGKSSGAKANTIREVRKQYGSQWVSGIKFRDEAVADSISIYHVGKMQSPVLKMMKK